MIRVDFKDDLLLTEIQDKFNDMYDLYYPELLGYTYYELYLKSNRYKTPDLWREFLMHPMVQNWYETELNLTLRSKANELLQMAGTDNSTAKAQQLSQILKELNSQKVERKEPIKYIFSFIPLTQDEADNENVKILEFIPKEIEQAIQSTSSRD